MKDYHALFIKNLRKAIEKSKEEGDKNENRKY